MLIKNLILIILYVLLATTSLIYLYIYKPDTTLVSKNVIFLTSLLMIILYIGFISYLIFTDKNRNWYSYISYGISFIFISGVFYSIFSIYDIYKDENNKKYLYSILKYISLISLVGFGMLGIAWLSNSSRFLAIIFSILMLIVCFGTIGYLIYDKFFKTSEDKKNNSLVMIALLYILSSNIIVKAKEIFNLFITSIKNTRIEILIILIIQIILITVYLLIPSIKSFIFNDINDNKIKEIKEKKTLREKTVDENIKMIKKDLKYLRNSFNFNDELWEDIYNNSDEIWKKSISDIEAYLQSDNVMAIQRFESLTDDPNNEDKEDEQQYFRNLRKFYRLFFEKKLMSLEESAKHIKANVPIILEKEATLKRLENEKNLLKLKGGKSDNLIKVVLKNPVYTNERRTYTMDKIDLGENNYNYSISSWFFIHNSPPNAKVTSNKFMNILNYNDKPKISFNTNKNKLHITYKIIDPLSANNKEQKLQDNSCGNVTSTNNFLKCTCGVDCGAINTVIDCNGDQYSNDCYKCQLWKNKCDKINKEDTKEKTIDIYTSKNIKLQKWNNLIINYSSGTLDIFLNGELVKTINGVFSKRNNGTITVGDDNGVDGGICNIIYFPSLLNINHIQTFYNLLKDKSPPII